MFFHLFLFRISSLIPYEYNVLLSERITFDRQRFCLRIYRKKYFKFHSLFALSIFISNKILNMNLNDYHNDPITPNRNSSRRRKANKTNKKFLFYVYINTPCRGKYKYQYIKYIFIRI